ncbi:cupin-like domain-containing protein [Saccharospirillum impatiens]|uniref:cupin-like domain-containing protein n=1 Tax=Saccharospirillum impatiens TaxID=169438 RepID=UPI00041F9FE6|nr:cupin-like domain-containing protein [Saccharospirillum impatiens]
MTLAHTPPSKDCPAAITALADFIRHGFENPDAISGCVQFNIPGNRQAYPLAISFSPAKLTIQHDWLEHTDATLTLPLNTAEYIVNNITEVDFRDPEIMGTIDLDGHLDLINHVAKSLLRPTEDTRARLEQAEQLDTPAYALTDIPRVSNPPELDILESIAASQPMIITALDMRAPHHHWSLERLEADYGDVPLRVRSADQKETVAAFIQRVRSADLENDRIIEGHTKAYTEGCFLPEPMHKDFIPNHFTQDDYIEPQIWLGSVPVNVPASSLHHDPMDGFLYQIMGRKKLIMYAPNQAPYLYPMKAYNNYQPCWVKPEAPDYQRYPHYAKARGIEVVLNPGELLVQPAGWFHAVYCLDSPTFSVSYFLRH